MSLPSGEQQKRKEKDEKLQMDRFRKLFSGFPQGKLIKSESPDFILKTGPKKSIGIEITSVVQENEIPSGLIPDNQSLTKSFSPDLFRKSVEEIIQVKEVKRKIYQRKRLDQIWLVISVSTKVRETSYNLDNYIERWNFDSRFNKVFLIIGDQKIHQLV